MVIYIPLLIALIGLVMFLVARTNADVKRIGEHMFWTGLFVTMLTLSSTHGFARFIP